MVNGGVSGAENASARSLAHSPHDLRPSPSLPCFLYLAHRTIPWLRSTSSLAAQLEPPPPGFRGSPSYPYGHPGYFNGRGGGEPTDTYGPAPAQSPSNRAHQFGQRAQALPRSRVDGFVPPAQHANLNMFRQLTMQAAWNLEQSDPAPT